MSNPYLRLRRGERFLNLTSGNFWPGPDFIPPAAVGIPSLATGTSANKYGGAVKIGEKLTDRTWQFSMRILGASQAEIDRDADAIAAFLRYAGDKRTPVYLDYRPNTDIAAVPLWGTFGGCYTYEITHADPPRLRETYGVSNLRSTGLFYDLTLTIKPYATTNRLKLATATGFVNQDMYGFAGIGARGVIVAKAGTNLFTNPVFGNTTSFSQGWTIGTDLDVTEDRSDHLFGGIPQAARVVRNRSAGTTTLTASVTAATTNLHALSCYVYQNTTAASPSGVIMYYDGLQVPTTWQSLGNGYYRGTGWPTAVVGAKAAGIDISEQGTIVVVTGFQFEDTGSAVTSYVATPFFYGDMLGCAWSGTRHLSSSTRTAGSIKIDCLSSITPAEGTIRICWQPDTANSLFASDVTLWSNGNLRLDFVASNNTFKFYVNYSSNVSISSAAQTFVAGDDMVIHCSWGVSAGTGGYRAITVNGVTSSSSASFTITAVTANLFIGCTTSSTQQIGGTIREFATYIHKITSAEALADYNNIAEALAEEICLAPVPYIWSRDGDNITDNGLDISGSTGAPHTNWVIMTGIPGTMPAITDLYGTSSSNWGTIKTVHINRMSIRQFYDPQGDQFGVTAFLHCKGTTNTVDTTATGGNSTVTSVSTTAVSFGNSIIYNKTGLAELLGKKFTALARVADAGTNGTLTASVYFSLGSIYQTDFQPVTSSASYKLIQLKGMVFPSERAFLGDKNATLPDMTMGVYFKRTTGSASVTFDYFELLPEETIRLTGPASSQTSFAVSGLAAVSGVAASLAGDIVRTTHTGLDVRGDAIELVPDVLNLYTVWSGDSTVNPLLSYTMTNYAIVTPRWGLL